MAADSNSVEYRAALVHDARKNQLNLSPFLKESVLKTSMYASNSRAHLNTDRSPNGKSPKQVISKNSIERLH